MRISVPTRSTILALLSLCAPVLAIASPPQSPTATPPAAIDTIPLDHLLQHHPGQCLPPWGSLLQQPLDRDEHVDRCDHLQAGPHTSGVRADELLGMLQHRHGAAIEAGRLQLAWLGTRLLIVGDEAEVAQVRSTALATARLLLRPIALEFAAWDASDRETPPATMTAEEFARFTGNRQPLWRSIAHGRSGCAQALQRLRWTDYIRDLDTAIAQKQAVSSPQVAQFADGGHAVMRAHLLLGNELVLHVQFAAAQRRGIVRSLQTGMAGAADIELPTLETNLGTASGRLRSGGALAVTLRGHASSGGQLVLTFRATLAAAADPELPPDLAVLPIGALGSRALLRPQPLPSASGDELPALGNQPELEREELHDLLRSVLGDGGFHDAGEFLIVQADAAALQRADLLLRTLQDRMLRNATVQHLGALQATDNTGAPAAAGAGGGPLHELVLPTLFGREAFAARVLETNVIARLFPEIAQEISILNPEVRALQAGCWLRARITQLGDGAHGDCEVRCTNAPPPQTRTIMPAGGVWMPTELAIAAANHDGPLRSGQPIDHGDGPPISVEGRSYRSGLATIVRW
jgi:hypothetical protein